MNLDEQNQRKIPRLSDLAFIAAKPQLNKEITAIANSDKSRVKKLQELRPFMDAEKQIAHYAQNHPQIRMLIDKQAEQHCLNLTSAKPIATPSIPHFDKQISASSQSYFLRNHYESLPSPHNQGSCVYAACLLNNGFLFGPADRLLQTLLHTTGAVDIATIHRLNYQLVLLSNAGKFALIQRIEADIEDQRRKQLGIIRTNYPSHTNLLFSDIPTYTIHHKPSTIAYDHKQTTSYAEINKALAALECIMQSSLTQHFDTVYSPDRKKVAVSSPESTIIYCLDTSNPTPAITIHRNDIKKMCFSQDGNFFFVTCGKSLSIYDLVRLEPIDRYSFGDTETIQALCSTSPSEITIIKSNAATNSFSFCSFDLQKQTWSNNYVMPLDETDTSVTAASFSHNGELMAVGCSNGKLLLIDRSTETTLWTLYHSSPMPINKIIFSADNSIITTLVNGSTACIWHTASGKCIKQFSLAITQKMTGTANDPITISTKEYSNFYAYDNPIIGGNITTHSGAQIDHHMPIVLLNIPVDQECLDLSQLDTSNTIVWKKTISANKLMLQKKLDNCGTVSDLLQFQQYLAASKNFSPYLQQSYSQKITDKIDVLLPQEIEHRAKCDRAARAFLLYLPNWTLNHAFRTFGKLHNDTKALVLQKACETQNLFALFFTRPKDIFIATLQKIIPQYELKSKVVKSDSQFTEYKNGYPEHKRAVLGPAPAQSAPQQRKLVSTHAAQQELFKKNSVEAFCTLSEYGEQKLITIDDLVEDPSHKDSCYGSDFGYYHDDGDLNRSYGLSLNDYIKTTVDQRALLQKIADGHNAGKYGDVDKRYKMTQQDIELLMPIKDIIDNNDLYKYLQIGADFAPKTTYEKVKDTLLLAIPLSIAQGIIPQIIHNNVNGNMQGVLGGIASYGSGFVIGKWIFPFFDAFNSNALKIRTWFGSSNKTTVQKSESFAALGLFHSIMHAIAEKFLSWQTLPYQALGYTMHGVRLLSSACNIVDIRSYVKKNSFLHNFASIFHLKKYEHPLHRRNKDDKSYTLGDLLNAQATDQ